MHTPPWHNQQPPYAWRYPDAPADPRTGLPLAGFGRRLAARVIDAVLLYVLALVLFVLTTLFLAVVVPDMSESGSDAVAEVWAYLLFFGWGLAFFLYDWLFLASSGRSPGKRMVAIRVVRADGGPLTQGRTAGRSVLFGLPQSVPCLGQVYLFVDCLLALTDPDRSQSLHDRAAGTLVIRD